MQSYISIATELVALYGCIKNIYFNTPYERSNQDRILIRRMLMDHNQYKNLYVAYFFINKGLNLYSTAPIVLTELFRSTHQPH